MDLYQHTFLPSDLPISLFIEPAALNLTSASGDTLELFLPSVDLSCTLPGFGGNIELYYNGERHSLVLGSGTGSYFYIIDTETLDLLCEMRLVRYGEPRFDLLITPDRQRIVVISELSIVVCTWGGEVLMAHPLTSRVELRTLEDDIIRVYDQTLQAEVAYKIPA